MLLGVSRLHEEDLVEALVREDRTEVEQVPAVTVGAAPADRSGFSGRDTDLLDRRAAHRVGHATDHRERARVGEELFRLLVLESSHVIARGLVAGDAVREILLPR